MSIYDYSPTSEELEWLDESDENAHKAESDDVRRQAIAHLLNYRGQFDEATAMAETLTNVDMRFALLQSLDFDVIE
jgi:hypothetical protein